MAASEETRTRFSDEFAKITESSVGVARRYLAESGWDMERALNRFYEEDLERAVMEEDPEQSTDASKHQRKKRKVPTSEGCIDLTGEEATSSAAVSTTAPCEAEDQLSLISWNVDGLDTDNLAERARGLCSYLVLYTPDVVFLQELIPPYVLYLQKRAVSYTLIQGGEDGYFTGMMLKKSRLTLLESEVVTFPTTQMMRNLLVAKVKFRGHDLCLMTSHLESCRGHAEERMRQLRVVMSRMKEAAGHVTVLFGGDTNLRDTEVAKVGLADGVCDVWEQLGRQEHCRYTWDTKTNTNKTVPYVSRCRFDRIYLRPANTEGVPRLAPDHMTLIGQDKLDCGRHVSDHWGIYSSFSV